MKNMWNEFSVRPIYLILIHQTPNWYESVQEFLRSSFLLCYQFRIEIVRLLTKTSTPLTIFTLAADGNELNISLLLIYNVLFAPQTEQPLRQIFIYTHCLLSAKCLLIRRPLSTANATRYTNTKPHHSNVLSFIDFSSSSAVVYWKKIESMYGQLTQMNRVIITRRVTYDKRKERKKNQKRNKIIAHLISNGTDDRFRIFDSVSFYVRTEFLIKNDSHWLGWLAWPGNSLQPP